MNVGANGVPPMLMVPLAALEGLPKLLVVCWAGVVTELSETT